MEVTPKTFEIDELKTTLAAKQKELTQMATEISDGNLMIERHKGRNSVWK